MQDTKRCTQKSSTVLCQSHLIQKAQETRNTRRKGKYNSVQKFRTFVIVEPTLLNKPVFASSKLLHFIFIYIFNCRKTKNKEKKKKSKKKNKRHKRHKKSKVNSELGPSTSKEIESGKSKRAKEHNFSTDSSKDSEYSDIDCERQNSKAKKRKRRNKSYSSSDSDEISDEPKKRQKFTSERPHSANDVKMAGNTTLSKSRKNSKHKKQKSPIGKSDSFGNDVVWLEKTS